MFRLLLSLLLVIFANFSFASEMVTGAGKFGIHEGIHNGYEGRLEYRWDEKLWKLRPIIGGLINNKNGNMIYAGVNIDLPLSDRYIFTVGVAPGIYHKGRGKNLGKEFQIKSQAELWLKLNDNIKAGLAISHISNARTYKINPGVESVVAQLSFDL